MARLHSLYSSYTCREGWRAIQMGGQSVLPSTAAFKGRPCGGNKDRSQTDTSEGSWLPSDYRRLPPPPPKEAQAMICPKRVKKTGSIRTALLAPLNLWVGALSCRALLRIDMYVRAPSPRKASWFKQVPCRVQCSSWLSTCRMLHPRSALPHNAVSRRPNRRLVGMMNRGAQLH